MTTTAELLRTCRGPALLSYGFRPFFLFGSLYAGLVVLLWLPVYFGAISLPTAFTPLDWHSHELLYGYLPAVAVGVLLLAAAILGPGMLPQSAALHAWTAGAIGVMTLAVMTRASLGHTGRALTASRATQAIYAAAVAGALCRVLAPVA